MSHKTVECPSVRPSVCPVDRQQQRRPAGLLLRSGAGPQQISVDSPCCRATCGPRKFWSDYNEVQHTCLLCCGSTIQPDVRLTDIGNVNNVNNANRNNASAPRLNAVGVIISQIFHIQRGEAGEQPLTDGVCCLQMESEKLSLESERSTTEQEKVGLRDELLRLERDKRDAETEKSGTLTVM